MEAGTNNTVSASTAPSLRMYLRIAEHLSSTVRAANVFDDPCQRF